MDAYLEISAIPNSEIHESALVSSLMQHVHRLLPNYEGRIGLSFPLYRARRTLGNSIRAHGIAADMQSFYNDLIDKPAIVDYALVAEPQSGPIGSRVKGHHAYIRVQPKGTSRLRRQEARHRRNGTWTQELAEHYSAIEKNTCALPYFNLKSDSNQNRFMLFVDRKVCSDPCTGRFGAYGVNSGVGKNTLVTVPWFD